MKRRGNEDRGTRETRTDEGRMENRERGMKAR